jgi:hypothetical protein
MEEGVGLPSCSSRPAGKIAVFDTPGGGAGQTGEGTMLIGLNLEGASVG